MAGKLGPYDAATTVSVDGLAELRKAFLDSGLASKEEVRDVMRAAAEHIVPVARGNVSHKPETLARSGYVPGTFEANVRSTTSGDRGVIRVPGARVPYGRLVEFSHQQGQSPIRRAIAEETPNAAAALEEALADLFRRHELLAD